jgi:hypothetical protein
MRNHWPELERNGFPENVSTSRKVNQDPFASPQASWLIFVARLQFDSARRLLQEGPQSAALITAPSTQQG